MTTITLTGTITETGKLEVQLSENLENGRLEVQLPDELTPGDVQVRIDLPGEPPLTPEELESLLRPTPPMTVREIMEAGLLGGWEDEGISDSTAWREEQRRKHDRRLSW